MTVFTKEQMLPFALPMMIAGVVSELYGALMALAEQDVVSRRLQTTHAFHSTMMDAIYEPFVEVLRGVDFGAPKIPWLSNVTGTWMSAEEAQIAKWYGVYDMRLPGVHMVRVVVPGGVITSAQARAMAQEWAFEPRIVDGEAVPRIGEVREVRFRTPS